jgi:hypothetical protein
MWISQVPSPPLRSQSQGTHGVFRASPRALMGSVAAGFTRKEFLCKYAFPGPAVSAQLALLTRPLAPGRPFVLRGTPAPLPPLDIPPGLHSSILSPPPLPRGSRFVAGDQEGVSTRLPAGAWVLIRVCDCSGVPSTLPRCFRTPTSIKWTWGSRCGAIALPPS